MYHFLKFLAYYNTLDSTIVDTENGIITEMLKTVV